MRKSKKSKLMLDDVVKIFEARERGNLYETAKQLNMSPQYLGSIWACLDAARAGDVEGAEQMLKPFKVPKMLKYVQLWQRLSVVRRDQFILAADDIHKQHKTYEKRKNKEGKRNEKH